MPDNTARIAEIRTLLQSGETTITIDGTTSRVDRINCGSNSAS
jgi:hypothetical protein